MTGIAAILKYPMYEYEEYDVKEDEKPKVEDKDSDEEEEKKENILLVYTGNG